MKLVNAKLYEGLIQEKMYNIWYDEAYQYYFDGMRRGEMFLSAMEGNMYAFGVLNDLDELIGFIKYSFNEATRVVENIGAINFTDDKKTFSLGLKKVLEDCFLKYGMNVIEWRVTCGNPIEKSYDRICKHYGGEIVGYRHDRFLDIKGELHDEKIYEIQRKNFLISHYHEEPEKKEQVDPLREQLKQICDGGMLNLKEPEKKPNQEFGNTSSTVTANQITNDYPSIQRSPEEESRIEKIVDAYLKTMGLSVAPIPGNEPVEFESSMHDESTIPESDLSERVTKWLKGQATLFHWKLRDGADGYSLHENACYAAVAMMRDIKRALHPDSWQLTNATRLIRRMDLSVSMMIYNATTVPHGMVEEIQVDLRPLIDTVYGKPGLDLTAAKRDVYLCHVTSPGHVTKITHNVLVLATDVEHARLQIQQLPYFEGMEIPSVQLIARGEKADA